MPKLRDRISSDETTVRDAGVAPGYYVLYVVFGALLAPFVYLLLSLPAIMRRAVESIMPPPTPTPAEIAATASPLLQWLPWLGSSRSRW